MRTSNRSRLMIIALGILLVIYCGFLIKNAWYAVSGSDSSGYASFARSIVDRNIVKPIAELKRLDLPDDFARIFIPWGYSQAAQPGAMAPLYPIGLPLHMAVAGLIGGWEYGPYLVNPIIAGLSLILTYLIGLELGLPRKFAVTAGILLAVHPTFLYLVLQPLSDATATFWALLVIWAALRSNRQDLWALLAGTAFGMAFLVRPSNILLLAPILFSLRLTPRVVVLFCLGGLPWAGIFFAYNFAAYGGIFKTGYIATGHEGLLKMTNVSARFKQYSYFLAMLIGPLVGLGWLGVALCRGISWRNRALIISWLGAFVLFYCFYDVYDLWWYTRFLLPGIPAMILGAMLTARELVNHFDRRFDWSPRIPLGWVAVAVLIVISTGFSGHYTIRRYHIWNDGKQELIHPESCRWADKIIPEQSLIFSRQMSGALKFYTGRLVARYDLISPDQWQVLKSRMGDKGYRCYALLWYSEVDEARKRLPGKWERIGFDQGNISLWQIEPES